MWRVDSLKRLWCWEGLGTGGERDDRGWDGWMVSPTWWTWVWVNSGSWWWTGRPGVLWLTGLQRVGYDWATELTDWLGLPRWLSGKESTCQGTPEMQVRSLGRVSGGGNGHLLQYSCLEISMDRGAWRATVHGIPKSQTQLSAHSDRRRWSDAVTLATSCSWLENHWIFSQFIEK